MHSAKYMVPLPTGKYTREMSPAPFEEADPSTPLVRPTFNRESLQELLGEGYTVKANSQRPHPLRDDMRAVTLVKYETISPIESGLIFWTCVPCELTVTAASASCCYAIENISCCSSLTDLMHTYRMQTLDALTALVDEACFNRKREQMDIEVCQADLDACLGIEQPHHS